MFLKNLKNPAAEIGARHQQQGRALPDDPQRIEFLDKTVKGHGEFAVAVDRLVMAGR